MFITYTIQLILHNFAQYLFVLHNTITLANIEIKELIDVLLIVSEITSRIL